MYYVALLIIHVFLIRSLVCVVCLNVHFSNYIYNSRSWMISVYHRHSLCYIFQHRGLYSDQLLTIRN